MLDKLIAQIDRDGKFLSLVKDCCNVTNQYRPLANAS